jgi:hypothetical protein
MLDVPDVPVRGVGSAGPDETVGAAGRMVGAWAIAGGAASEGGGGGTDTAPGPVTAPGVCGDGVVDTSPAAGVEDASRPRAPLIRDWATAARSTVSTSSGSNEVPR